MLLLVYCWLPVWIAMQTSNNLQATISKTVHPMLSRHCLSCLSYPVLSCLSVLTLVYCGQTVGWIKMELGVKVGLGPGHIVLDGDPAPPKGHSPPQFSADVCCVQTAGWIEMPLGLGPGNIVLDLDPVPPSKKIAQQPFPTFRPVFLAYVHCGDLWPNSWMDQDTTWYGGRTRPR